MAQLIGYYFLVHREFRRYLLGSTSNILHAQGTHKADLIQGIHRNKELQFIFKRWEDFDIDFYPTSTIQEARQKEQEILDEYYLDQNCLNIDFLRHYTGVAQDRYSAKNIPGLKVDAPRDPVYVDLVLVNGRRYKSVDDAATGEGISSETVLNRIASDAGQYIGWKYGRGLR